MPAISKSSWLFPLKLLYYAYQRSFIRWCQHRGVSIEELLNVHCMSDGERFFYFTVKLYNTTSDNFKYIYSIDIFFFYFCVVQVAQRRLYLHFFCLWWTKKGVWGVPQQAKNKTRWQRILFFSASVYTLAMLAKLRFEPFRKSKGIAI